MTTTPSNAHAASGEGRRALVVGAGLAGCLLATYLARDGWKVTLCERRGDPRKAGAGGGRSINLAISARGLKALRRAGLEEKVLAEGVRMPGRVIHPVAGDSFFTPYSADPSRAINSVSRGGLNRLLLEAAEAEANCEVFFDRRAIDIDFDRGAVEFETPAGRETPRGGPCRRHRRRVLGDPRRHAAERTLRLLAGVPRARVQGTGHSADRRGQRPARAVRAVGDGSGGPSHLAARRVDDDRAAQPRRLLHLHALLARGTARVPLPRSRPPRRRPRTSRRCIPTRCR